LVEQRFRRRTFEYGHSNGRFGKSPCGWYVDFNCFQGQRSGIAGLGRLTFGLWNGVARIGSKI
jgi:hypothetical protein